MLTTARKFKRRSKSARASLIFERDFEHKGSVVGIHMREHHGESTSRIENCFSILRKCRGKYECLLYEMLYIRELKPSLNTQSDSINSKLFN